VRFCCCLARQIPARSHDSTGRCPGQPQTILTVLTHRAATKTHSSTGYIAEGIAQHGQLRQLIACR
jgi:hypothetical protein